MEREYLLLPGQKTLGEVSKIKPTQKAKAPHLPNVRVNGRIHCERLDLRGEDGNRIGIFDLKDALALVRSNDMDVVEISRSSSVSVCLLIIFGKFRYRTRNARLPRKWLRQLPPAA